MIPDLIFISQGRASLGRWGSLELTGASSALLRPTMSENVEVPAAVAWDLTAGALLLNDDLGKLLFLPHSGKVVIAYDLTTGKTAYPAMNIPRADDRGLRTATIRIVPQFGVVYLTEATLAAFREDLDVAWRHDDDFAGWTIEGVTHDEVLLVISDWTGNEQRQSRSLATGDHAG